MRANSVSSCSEVRSQVFHEFSRVCVCTPWNHRSPFGVSLQGSAAESDQLGVPAVVPHGVLVVKAIFASLCHG